MFRLQTTVSREGWFYMAIVLIVFGGAVSKEVNLLLILAGMMFCPLLINWAGGAVHAARVAGGTAIAAAFVGRGGVFRRPDRWPNTRPRLSSWAVVVEEQISPECVRAKTDRRRPPLRTERVVPLRPGRCATAKGSYHGRLPRRGRYRFGPLRLTTRFPFGLFSRTITVGPVETLTVLPRLGKLTRVWNGAAVGGHRRRRPPPPPARHRGRFLRRPRVAAAAQPAADSLAQLRPAGHTGSCASSSGRRAATRRSCSTCGSPRRPPTRTSTPSSWPSASPAPCWPTCAVAGGATSTWASAAQRAAGQACAPADSTAGPAYRKDNAARGKGTGTICRNGPKAGTDAKRWSSHTNGAGPLLPANRRSFSAGRPRRRHCKA